MGLKSTIKGQMVKLLDWRYAKKRRRRLLDYQTWITNLEKEEASAFPSDAGEFDMELFVFGKGSLAEGAAARFAGYFANHPEALLAYGDEDVAEKGGAFGNPWLKPDWSPDSYLCRDYLGSVIAVRKSLSEKLGAKERAEEGVCHDRLVELAGGFEKGCRSIAHVKGICFHRTKSWPLPGEGRQGKLPAGLSQKSDSKANLVSVIIPSKDNVSVLKHCLETLCKTVKDIPFEIIVVDNGSSEVTRKAVSIEIEKLNCDLKLAKCLKRATYFFEPMEFNFSRMCNLGAGRAEGSLLLFLNDDMEAVEEGWMENMALQALCPWTGAVGMKLLYPDSGCIQHAGITNIAIGPVHKLQSLKDNRRYYDGRNTGVWNVLAVTGACLMLRRELFAQTGGFAEEMPVAFNDVDLCFTLYETGFRNVIINTGHLLHHESLSRGYDETEEKKKRLAGEREILYKRHPQLEGRDPFYHPWLNGEVLDTRIVPAYEEGMSFADAEEYMPAGSLDGIRRDDCLIVRVEHAAGGRLRGYAVVLGSDNACFTKQLLFCPQNDRKTVYRMDYKEQYRSDLEENMPDQKNVALCGFSVEFAKPLPEGEYRVGALARDKISGACLMNWCSRTVVF